MENLRNLRIQNHLSQALIAEALGVSQTSICHWESGLKVIPFKYYPKIATLFGVNLETVIPEDMEVILKLRSNHEETYTANALELYQQLLAQKDQMIASQVATINQQEEEIRRLRLNDCSI